LAQKPSKNHMEDKLLSVSNEHLKIIVWVAFCVLFINFIMTKYYYILNINYVTKKCSIGFNFIGTCKDFLIILFYFFLDLIVLINN
jgi:hypothetical protein